MLDLHFIRKYKWLADCAAEYVVHSRTICQPIGNLENAQFIYPYLSL